jgi:hypothetical protein
MRRSLITATLALIALAWPAEAQIFPTPGSAPAGVTGRVVLDASLMVIPPSEIAPCMQLEAGTLTVRGRDTNADDSIRPTTFHFVGYRGVDPGAHIDLRITNKVNTITVPLSGGVYCWSIDVYAPASDTGGLAARTSSSQGVDLRMTLAPQ